MIWNFVSWDLFWIWILGFGIFAAGELAKANVAHKQSTA